MPLTVRFVSRAPEGVSRARLKWLGKAVMVAAGCGLHAELSVAIGNDRWIQELNQKYKGKNAPTDVLAFPPGEGPGEAQLLGDVAISAETAWRQARLAGHDLTTELALLLTHAVLHLTGWRDDTPARRRRMMKQTRELLARASQMVQPAKGATSRAPANRARR